MVILDEFQRFKDLLDGEDEAAKLARALFDYPNVRILLLSATPYKMLSLDYEQDDDHYPDFLRTLKFLCEDPTAVEQIRHHIQAYREVLFDCNLDDTRIDQLRGSLQTQLLKVMCRTERVSMTHKLDAMLTEKLRTADIKPIDLKQAKIACRSALAVQASEPIEYWKSSPYLLNFSRNYELRKRIDAMIETPPQELLNALQNVDGQMLEKDTLYNYNKIKAANPRMRVLFQDMLERGIHRFLWLPSSMPYTIPQGVYKDVGSVTKTLIFSSWNIVPDAIAALCSYETERQMIADSARDLKHNELYDRLRPLLRFTKGRDDRLTGMPALAWLLPSPTLASIIDPLEISLNVGRGEPIRLNDLLEVARNVCENLLTKLPEGNPGSRPDERWYWAAVAMLNATKFKINWKHCLEGQDFDADQDAESLFRDHLELFSRSASGDIDLGPRPSDLPKVLTELALSGPGTVALRALQRIASSVSWADPVLLNAATRIASGFRTLFNLPETIALLRGWAEDSYWRLTLRYALEGNLQAVLDEHMHVLVETLGLTDSTEHTRLEGVSKSAAKALSIRTAQIKIDELRPKNGKIEKTGFNMRCRFALRFGDLKDDQDGNLARADTVREAFNSPFRPFILASTSIGQEGLDFHTWCHAVMHWNLPANPVDLEQREGRVHRYKGHAVRKNIAERYGLSALQRWSRKGDPWSYMFERAVTDRPQGFSDLVPYWIFEEGSARVERRIPLIPFSREVQQLERLKRGLALYRVVFGQPRQEDLLSFLANHVKPESFEYVMAKWRISLEPPDPSRS